jgi:hypothetical protein
MGRDFLREAFKYRSPVAIILHRFDKTGKGFRFGDRHQGCIRTIDRAHFHLGVRVADDGLVLDSIFWKRAGWREVPKVYADLFAQAGAG